jgi:hypothetical protein
MDLQEVEWGGGGFMDWIYLAEDGAGGGLL